MTLSEAESFIKSSFAYTKQPVTWADLGCGSGIFTNALVNLLPAGSKIYAVDRDMQTFDFESQDVDVSFSKSNIEFEDLPFKQVDGVIMANSLHYIKDQGVMIEKIKRHLGEVGKIILIEYDTDQSNQWVPYPIRFEKAVSLFKNCGFKEVIKLGERQSIYRSDKIYACLIH